MDTNMTPINDSELQQPQQKQQINFMNDEEEDHHNFYNRMPQFQPPPQQIYPFDEGNKKDIFANMDKTAYIVIFVAFILGFFMGKTMQPVILRPG